MIGHRRVVDSTGIADCVVTMDTITLIRSATRHCLDRFAKLDKHGAAITLLCTHACRPRRAGKARDQLVERGGAT